MSLKEIFSCYVSKTYSGDKQTFERILQYFKDVSHHTEEQWKQIIADERKAVFRKGASFVFTFDYESPNIEVQSVVVYSEAEGTITISVGNSGFPFEPLLSKPRYIKLLDKIDAYIIVYLQEAGLANVHVLSNSSQRDRAIALDNITLKGHQFLKEERNKVDDDSRKRECTSLNIFLAHAKEDEDDVLSLYNRLKEQGFNPWLDKKNLIPGQNWKQEISRAIKNSDIFIACLSRQSIRKKGYVQKEFKMAISHYAEMPPQSIYLIPLRLDECEIPELRQDDYGVNLLDIQWLDYWKSEGFDELMKSIKYLQDNNVR